MLQMLSLAVPVTVAWPATAETYHVAQTDPAASDDNPGTADQPWLTINKAASLMQAGDKVIVHAGIYREHVDPQNSGTPGSPIIYEAAGGEEVIVTGADVLTDWEASGDDRPIYQIPWTAKFIINHVNGVPIYHHPADEAHKRSGRPEELIVDGEVWDYPQLVLSVDDMEAGTFFPDVDNDILYVWLPDGSDPNDHEIQGTTRGLTFGTNPWRGNTFDYVWVRGFTFRFAASFAQRPAVWLLGSHNLVEDCVVEWMGGGGVGVGPESGVLRHCVIRNCGHTGGSATGRDFLNEDCTWAGNCRKPISRGWDAGGVKICQSHGGEFRRCVFRNNGGPGLWMDIDDANIVVRDSLFEDNEYQGLFIEISRDIHVMNNAFFRNGLRTEDGGWSVAGLTLAESRNCVVTHNLLVGNKDGIALREQGPRYLDTPDLGRVAFQNVGHVIADNVSANNPGYQLGLWYDTAWFGMHPGQKDDYKSEEDFSERYPDEHCDQWFDPLKQGLIIDRNVYWAAEGQKLALYGCPWRVRYQEFEDLTGLAEATGLERNGRVVDPDLKEVEPGHWRLPTDGELFQEGFGPRHPVADG